MAIESYLLTCFEEKQPIILTEEILEKVELKDIFAIIHMIESGFDVQLSINEEDRVFWDFDIRGDILNFYWPGQNTELAVIAVMLYYLKISGSMYRVTINLQNQQVHYVYHNPADFIKQAEEACIINHSMTRQLMRPLEINYSNLESSKEFFDHYLGLVNTKSARST